MKWAYNHKSHEWTSTDGKYSVWVQARPRDDYPHWGARRNIPHAPGGGIFLTEFAFSKSDAIRVCEEDRPWRNEDGSMRSRVAT